MKTMAAVLCITFLAVTSADAKRDAGPDLPWPCWLVRANALARGLTPPLTAAMRKQIAALEKEHGITPKQHAQAAACFAQAAKAAKQGRARRR